MTYTLNLTANDLSFGVQGGVGYGFFTDKTTIRQRVFKTSQHFNISISYSKKSWKHIEIVGDIGLARKGAKFFSHFKGNYNKNYFYNVNIIEWETGPFIKLKTGQKITNIIKDLYLQPGGGLESSINSNVNVSYQGNPLYEDNLMKHLGFFYEFIFGMEFSPFNNSKTEYVFEVKYHRGSRALGELLSRISPKNTNEMIRYKSAPNYLFPILDSQQIPHYLSINMGLKF